MKLLTIRIDENPRDVLEAFSSEELLMELVLRDDLGSRFNPTPVSVNHYEPVRQFIIGIGKDDSVSLFLSPESLQTLKEIACLTK